jgi:hypothetical protein
MRDDKVPRQTEEPLNNGSILRIIDVHCRNQRDPDEGRIAKSDQEGSARNKRNHELNHTFMLANSLAADH